jgi:flagellar basal-body rod modification protein FlgD
MEAVPSISELFPSSSPAAIRAPGELGQEDFMRLMVAQMENQDPTKPMDNFEFLSQIAQFGTVDGIQGIEKGVEGLGNAILSNQALQAVDLVGHQIMTDSNLGELTGAEGATLDATISLPDTAAEVTLYIQDLSGRLVYSQPLGPAAAGNKGVQWNGLDESGSAVPPGQYRVSAEALIGGKAQAVPVYTHSEVVSVTIDGAGGAPVLSLSSGDQVSLAEVKSFL